MKELALWPTVFRAIEIAKAGGHSVSIHFSTEYPEGFADYQAIKRACLGWFEGFVADGDLRVEMYKPDTYEVKGKAPGLPEAARLAAIEALPASSAADSLREIAVKRLGIPYQRLALLSSVASTIARMGESSEVKAEHMAEAVGYMQLGPLRYDAESEMVVFGDAVFIRAGHISDAVMQQAMTYLTAKQVVQCS